MVWAYDIDMLQSMQTCVQFLGYTKVWYWFPYELWWFRC